VVVMVVPVERGGVLTVRRAIHPGIGELALIGGYMDFGELISGACARELFEETGIARVADEFKHIKTISPPGGKSVLIFLEMVGAPVTRAEVAAMVPNDEVSEFVVVESAVPLVFATHTQVLEEYI
jgi:ADP-ribose pyrophosphatase YjhB (NUDIX family)